MPLSFEEMQEQADAGVPRPAPEAVANLPGRLQRASEESAEDLLATAGRAAGEADLRGSLQRAAERLAGSMGDILSGRLQASLRFVLTRALHDTCEPLLFAARRLASESSISPEKYLAWQMCSFTVASLQALAPHCDLRVIYGSKLLLHDERDIQVLSKVASRLVRSWRVNEPSLKRALQARMAEGKGWDTAKMEALLAGLCLAVQERERPQRVRFGKDYVVGSDGAVLMLRPVDLPAIFYWRWIRHQGIKAAEALLLDKPYPPLLDEDGKPHTDVLDLAQLDDGPWADVQRSECADGLLDPPESMRRVAFDPEGTAGAGDDEEDTWLARPGVVDEVVQIPDESALAESRSLLEVVSGEGAAAVGLSDLLAVASQQQRDILQVLYQILTEDEPPPGLSVAVARRLHIQEGQARMQMTRLRRKLTK